MATMKKRTTTASKPQGIESRITSVAEIPIEINALLYGRSGTGKTTIIGSAPKPLLILDIGEKGTTSIRDLKDVFVLSINSWKDFEEAYWFLFSKEGRKFKSIAIDTVTQLQDLALQQVRGGKTEGSVSQKSWGEASSLLKTWIILFRDLPNSTFYLAQDRIKKGVSEYEDDEDDDSSPLVPEVGPYVMPSVAKILNAAVDIIGYTFIRENIKTSIKGGKKTQTRNIEYCLRVGPHPIYITKFRSPQGQDIPDVLVSPTVAKLVELSFSSK